MARSHGAAFLNSSHTHSHTHSHTQKKTRPLEAILTLIQGEEQDVEAQASQQGTQRRLPPTIQRILVTKDQPDTPPGGKGGEPAQVSH